MQGLTEALSRILQLTEEDALGPAIVACVCDHLGYARARFYRFDADRNALISRSCCGLDPERAGRFATGHVVQRRAPQDAPSNFAVFDGGQPLIFLLSDCTHETLPLNQVSIDFRSRRVFLVARSEEQFAEELDKLDVPEWLDVPLVSENELLGKLSIDLKGTERRFGLEDIELLGLFGHWAAEALAKVLALEKAKHKAELVQDVGLLGKDQGVESLAWDFLVNITLEGGPGFNRAVLFLKHPQTGYMNGCYCHGAANGADWQQILEAVRVRGNRRDFLEEARRVRDDGDGSDTQREVRLDALRAMRLFEEHLGNPFVQAWKESRSILVQGAEGSLAWLYDALKWQPAAQALICPLVHEQECEGLLYVDRAFVAATSQSISDGDRALVETLCYHFAAIAQPLRLGRQLHEMVLGVSHKLISPMSSVYELAQAMNEATTEEDRRTCVDHIIAESKRAAHTVRTLLRAASGEPFRPVFRSFDLRTCYWNGWPHIWFSCARTASTQEIRLSMKPVEMEGDPDLLGDVFAELADNARTALLAGDEPADNARFRVSCRTSHAGDRCLLIFTNSGTPVPLGLSQRLFDRYVSGTGSTGLGLPLVKAVVQAHRGSVAFRFTRRDWSRFLVSLPLKRH